jgi:hypothetical protein
MQMLLRGNDVPHLQFGAGILTGDVLAMVLRQE